jgi:hypothetical protein
MDHTLWNTENGRDAECVLFIFLSAVMLNLSAEIFWIVRVKPYINQQFIGVADLCRAFNWQALSKKACIQRFSGDTLFW